MRQSPNLRESQRSPKVGHNTSLAKINKGNAEQVRAAELLRLAEASGRGNEQAEHTATARASATTARESTRSEDKAKTGEGGSDLGGLQGTCNAHGQSGKGSHYRQRQEGQGEGVAKRLDHCQAAKANEPAPLQVDGKAGLDLS